jgi:hypothetical protein
MIPHLITASEIKANTVADLTLGAHKLAVAIPLAQGKRLRPAVGEELFEALLALAATAPVAPVAPAANAAPNLREAYASELATYTAALASWRTANTGALLTLWDQCKAMLCAWAIVEAWPSLLGHITEAGFVTKVGEKTQGTSTADVQLTDRTLGYLTDTASYQHEEFARWLAKNAAAYTQYRPVSTTPTCRPTQIGGIYLG